MSRRIVAALVVALLAVSCTPAQPPEPQVTALKPTKKISHVLSLGCPLLARACVGGQSYLSSTSDRRKTAAIVSQLRQENPSWLRYIQAVEVVEMPTLQSKSERLRGAEVQTGIFFNEAGRDLGAEICLAILKEELDGVSIYGVFEDSQYRADSRTIFKPTRIRIPVLAGCHQ